MNTQGAHRYEDRLLEFAYGELPAAEARSIEAHVKGCARCSGALREIEGVRQQMSQLAPEPAPDAGLESLLAYAQQSARRAQAGPAPARGVRKWLFGVVGAASLGAVLVVVGVVSTRTSPELSSLSAEALKKEAVKQELRAQEAAASAGTAAAAPVPEPQQMGQGWAPETQDKAKGQADSPKPVAAVTGKSADPAARAEKDAQVGRAVGSDYGGEYGRQGEYVQRVDVQSPEEPKLGTRESPEYRQAGPDMLDRGQNFIPGRGTRPVLPTSSDQNVASRKTAPLPADGEVIFPTEPKGGGLASASKRSKKAPSRSREPLAGSGGGLGDVAAAAPASDEDARASDDFEAPMQQKLAEEKSVRRRGAQQQQELEREQAMKAKAKEQEAPRELAKNAPAMAEAAPVYAPPPAPAAAPAPATPAPRVASVPQGESPEGTRLSMNAGAGAPGSKRDLDTAPARKAQTAAPAPAPSRARAPSSQALLAEANRARAGSPEEIDALIGALDAGLSGKLRIGALQRLCTRLESQGDERAWSYCSAWANADPGSAIAAKRAKAAEERMRKAKARQAQPAEAVPVQ